MNYIDTNLPFESVYKNVEQGFNTELSLSVMQQWKYVGWFKPNVNYKLLPELDKNQFRFLTMHLQS